MKRIITVLLVFYSVMVFGQGATPNLRSSPPFFTNMEFSNLIDETGNCTLTNNGATSTTGKRGNALSFDGINDNVSSSTNSKLENTVGSFSFWVYPNVYSGNQIWVSINDGTTANRIVCYNSATTYFIFTSVSGIGGNRWTKTGLTTDIPLSQWTHIVATFNTVTDNYDIYVNGVQKTPTSTDTSGNPSGIDEISLGSRVDRSSSFYNGRLDEVYISSRELKEIEAKQQYASGNGLLYVYDNFKNGKITFGEYLEYYLEYLKYKA